MDEKKREETLTVVGSAVAVVVALMLFGWMSKRSEFCYQNIGSTMDYSCEKWMMSGGDCIANWAPASCEWLVKCTNGTSYYEPCEGCC
jgi:hypothetical protein